MIYFLFTYLLINSFLAGQNFEENKQKFTKLRRLVIISIIIILFGLILLFFRAMYRSWAEGKRMIKEGRF